MIKLISPKDINQRNLGIYLLLITDKLQTNKVISVLKKRIFDLFELRTQSLYKFEIIDCLDRLVIYMLTYLNIS